MILSIVLPKVFQKIPIAKPIIKLTNSVKNNLGASLKKKETPTFFTIGFLNGFLPCGLVYMAVFGALATTNTFSGSLYMFLFGVGTIPLMTSVVYLGNFTKGAFRKNIQKLLPVFVVCIGVLFILRGLGLGIPYISPVPINSAAVLTVVGCH